jgi:hypothetical protein
MELGQLASALVGAFLGGVVTLTVGLTLQRRDRAARARSAARAVWFELGINAVAIELARDHGVFSDLSRSTFERLLPDLATWLPLDDLRAVATAYQGHAGFEQARHDSTLPGTVRAQLLGRLAEVTHQAHDRIAARAFGREALAPAPTVADARSR